MIEEKKQELKATVKAWLDEVIEGGIIVQIDNKEYLSLLTALNIASEHYRSLSLL